MVGWKFTVFLLCFTLYLRAIFKYNPLGSLYLEGRFNGWFFAFTSLGGLQMEGLIFGILRYLAQILGQYFTGPGLCRPFFVRWTGVDFGTWDVQGGKTFCASFCASLIAGSRRAFLCVDCVCLLLEFWVKCTRCERLFPVKHFYLTCLLFLRRLKITLDSEQPMLQEKRIIPSVWGGIKGFEHFLRGEYFSDCASD